VEQEADARRSRMTVSIPPIISVDDHVIEPPDLWQRWLPVRFREAGPRVVRGPYEMVPGSEIDRAARSGWNAFRPATDGPETDWWLFEGGLSATLLGNAAAAVFSELPSVHGLPSIHDPNGYWDPFFAACDETGTVVCIHIGSSGQGQMTSGDAPLTVPIALTTVASQFAMADWLLSGNLARFPHLKLAFSESQIGWMPFLWERLDNLWRKHNYADDWNPLITEPPSHYVRGHIWGCFFEDEFGLRSRYDIGVDIITFECDYPHQDSTWPNTLGYAEKILGDLPEEEVFKIVRSNAIELFGLEPELAGQAGD
jgi:Amidohydrolase